MYPQPSLESPTSENESEDAVLREDMGKLERRASNAEMWCKFLEDQYLVLQLERRGVRSPKQEEELEVRRNRITSAVGMFESYRKKQEEAAIQAHKAENKLITLSSVQPYSCHPCPPPPPYSCHPSYAEVKCKMLEERILKLEEELKVMRNNTRRTDEAVESLDIQLQHASACLEASEENQSMMYASINDMQTLIDSLKSEVATAETQADIAEVRIMLSKFIFELTDELNLLKGRLDCFEASAQPVVQPHSCHPYPDPSQPGTYPANYEHNAGIYAHPTSLELDGSYSNRINPQAVPASLNFSGPSSPTDGHNMQLAPYSPSKGSLEVLLLHGNLDIWIYDAKCLPNMDNFNRASVDVLRILSGKGGSKLDGTAPKITSDPYVSISITDIVIGRTFVSSNEENPVWMQHFYVPVAHSAAEVDFNVRFSGVLGTQVIGTVSIPAEQIFSGMVVKGTYSILRDNGRPCKPGAVLSLSVQYIPMKNLSLYRNGAGSSPDYQGVPGTYFPLRRGGTVTLYQDAHVPDGLLPCPTLDTGFQYLHGKCWEDIFNAITNARRLVYIMGWSVWHELRLVRHSSPASECSLGELLRSKSRQGVRVLLLLWRDPTSGSFGGYKSDGLLAPHCEDTRRFFEKSSVIVLLCPRIVGKQHSWIKQKEVEAIYTHHQKTVIVDADAGNNKRKIIAFVGGLDLCDGRYDTPEHSLFRTLNTVHKDDYHNPSFKGRIDGCPREPWHDLHCKIDGPAAYDVLTNFHERWFKAAKSPGTKNTDTSHDDALLRIEKIKDILGMSDAPFLSDDNPEAWHVQILRSINSDSVEGFPKNPEDATRKNLVCGEDAFIDMSIHTAYVKAIRSAQHYIYIENQYFIGSSYNWNKHKDRGADNLIPMEIALKVANKIRARERFAVYIVIPMWPEGVPTDGVTQGILYWQNQTMQMMYETIYKALVEARLQDECSPQDYLNFFCLGNRESSDGSQSSTNGTPHLPNTSQALCQKSRRFMIYVHSKGMIVDDEYVILGSANINQRSMDGERDTEIAMGGYQPNYTWAKKSAQPRGQVYGYRMSLWAEHLGGIEETYDRPETLECVERVRSQAEINWKKFVSEDVTEMKGHLLKYPVHVTNTGEVKPLEGHEVFPDLKGETSGYLTYFTGIEKKLTT